MCLVEELGMTEREVSWLFPADGTWQARVQIAVRLLAFLMVCALLAALYLAGHAVGEGLGDFLVGAGTDAASAMSPGVIR